MTDANPTARTTSPLLIAVLAVGALLVVGVIVIVVLLLTGRGGHANASAPSPSPTFTSSQTPNPTTTDSSGPSQPPAPAPQGDPQNAYFTAFDPDVDCHQDTPLPIGLVWDSKHAVSAQFVYEAPNGDRQYYDIPVRGNALPDGLVYPCTDDPMKFDIVLLGEDGVSVGKSWTVENVGYVYPKF